VEGNGPSIPYFIGKERAIESFRGFFTMIGDEVASKIVFVCSDMVPPGDVLPHRADEEIARSLRGHRELILNHFRAQKLVTSGVVEGLNNKPKVTMRKSYGFRTFRCLEPALYHSLGKLPEPESTHHLF
jgi:Transposase